MLKNVMRELSKIKLCFLIFRFVKNVENAIYEHNQ